MTQKNQAIFEQIKGGLIVSCQALPDEPLHGSYIMSRMAYAAMLGGAVGIRANTIPDITEIKKTVDLPIIGIIKEVYEILESLLEKQAQTGDVNPIFSIFLMKNHFGYADKKEYILTPQQPLGDTQTQKALEDKLSDIIESEE